MVDWLFKIIIYDKYVLKSFIYIIGIPNKDFVASECLTRLIK